MTLGRGQALNQECLWHLDPQFIIKPGKTSTKEGELKGILSGTHSPSFDLSAANCTCNEIILISLSIKFSTQNNQSIIISFK